MWKQVGADLIGPMPTTPRGNKYIITLTDYFSKWAEAAALPDKSAKGVAKFIYKVSWYRYYNSENKYNCSMHGVKLHGWEHFLMDITVHLRLCVEWAVRKL